jgi:hypothetical protein
VSGDSREQLPGQRRELRLDGPERARVLREEDVCGRVVALLGDLRGQLGGVAVANLDGQPAGLFEVLDQVADQRLVAAGVDRQVGVFAAASRDGREREQSKDDGGGTTHARTPLGGQEGKTTTGPS